MIFPWFSHSASPLFETHHKLSRVQPQEELEEREEVEVEGGAKCADWGGRIRDGSGTDPWIRVSDGNRKGMWVFGVTR